MSSPPIDEEPLFHLGTGLDLALFLHCRLLLLLLLLFAAQAEIGSRLLRLLEPARMAGNDLTLRGVELHIAVEGLTVLGLAAVETYGLALAESLDLVFRECYSIHALAS